jgi:hypothetical protein
MHPPPEFLDFDDVIELHASGLAGWGGSEGVRSNRRRPSAFGSPLVHESQGCNAYKGETS